MSYQSLDDTGCFLDVNPTWLRTLGYERDEVIGSSFADYLHPSWKVHFEKNFPAFKKRGYVHDVQFKIRHKDGHYIDISFEGCVGYYPDGAFRQTHCVFPDITTRKQAEDALVRSAEALKKAQRVAHVGSWEWDIATGRLEWSDEMYRIFGIDKDDFPGTLDDVIARSIHPDDRAVVEDSNQSVIDQKKPIPVEYRIIRPDGSIRTVWAEAGELVVDEDGKPAMLSGVVMDITERRAAEESSRRNELLLKEAQAIAHIGNWEWRPKDDRIILPSGLIRVLEAKFQFVYEEDGNATRLVGTLQDISERDAYEKKLQAANVRLEALWSVSSLGEADIGEVSNHVIRTITAMTGSSYAFYGFINEDESVMRINSWSGGAMNDCAIIHKPMDFPVDEAGLWAEAIRRRTPLIINDYSRELPGKKGLPSGHVELTNLLVVPHSIDGRYVSLAAVANRDTDYDEEDVKQLSSFLQSIHGILASKQAMKEREILQKQLAMRKSLNRLEVSRVELR